MDTTEKQIRDMFCNSGPFDRDEIALLMLQLVERIQNLEQAPQRQWVGLTPQERDEINEQVYGAVPHHVAFHHAIEAKLKEKNT